MPTRKSPVKTAAAPTVPAPVAPVESITLTVEDATRKFEQITDVRQVSSALMDEMMRRIPPSRIVDKLESLIDAKRWTGKGKGAREVPDLTAQALGLRYIVPYILGLPVQHQEIITTHVESENQLVERMRYSPATLRHMEALIEQIKAEQAGGAS